MTLPPRFWPAAAGFGLAVTTITLLLALGDADWRRCTGAPIPWGILGLTLETLLGNFGKFLLICAPPAFIAMSIAHSPTDSQADVQWIALGLLMLALIWFLLPPSGQHECDDIGPRGLTVLLAALPLALVLAIGGRLIHWKDLER